MHFPKNKMRSILLAQFFLMKKSISQFLIFRNHEYDLFLYIVKNKTYLHRDLNNTVVVLFYAQK